MADDTKMELRPTRLSLIEIVLEHLDDRDDLAIAEQRMAELRAGRSTTISLEELMKQYGMFDELALLKLDRECSRLAD